MKEIKFPVKVYKSSHNVCSRIGMPAIIYSWNSFYWKFNGKSHRINGKQHIVPILDGFNNESWCVLYGEDIVFNFEIDRDTKLNITKLVI